MSPEPVAGVRQQVLAAIEARLLVILRANGYQTDAGVAVYLGEAPPLGPDDPPAAIAIVVRDDIPSDQGDVVHVVQPLELQALANVSCQRPWQTVEAVLADLTRAIEIEDRGAGGLLVRDLVRGRTRTLLREVGTTTVGVGREYRVTYAERWGGAAA